MKRVPKEIEPLKSEPEVMKQSPPMPSLITLNEFVLTLSKQRTHYFESLGSFSYWIKKEGCPKKWPFEFWEKEFQRFLCRAVK
jgi:hypothetical protein